MTGERSAEMKLARAILTSLDLTIRLSQNPFSLNERLKEERFSH